MKRCPERSMQSSTAAASHRESLRIILSHTCYKRLFFVKASRSSTDLVIREKGLLLRHGEMACRQRLFLICAHVAPRGF